MAFSLVRAFRVTVAGAGCAALAACSATVGPDHARVHESREFDASAVPNVELVTFDGAIEVRAWDQPKVRVDIEKFGSSREAAESIAVRASQDGDSIRVEAARPPGARWGMNSVANVSSRARLIALVPRECNLIVNSGDGGLTVERVNGTIQLTTADGFVKGYELEGDVVVDTGDGSVKLERVSGSLRVRSGDGPVSLGGRLSRLNVFTSDGMVALRLEPGSHVDGDWEVTTGDGGVVVYLPDDLRADVDAATGDGTVRAESGLNLHESARTRRTLRGMLGEGGRVMKIRTGDGSISLHKQ